MTSTSRSPGCATRFEPSITTLTSGNFSTGNTPFRFPFTIVEVCMAVLLSYSLSGQYIAKASVHHIGVSVLGVPGRGEIRPRAAYQVRILGDDLQPPVAIVGPQSGDYAERGFLNGSVRRIRRSWETEAYASE